MTTHALHHKSAKRPVDATSSHQVTLKKYQSHINIMIHERMDTDKVRFCTAGSLHLGSTTEKPTPHISSVPCLLSALEFLPSTRSGSL
eukprot:2719880-Amphidinium_carterae.1